jgi:predicted permease
MQNAMRDLRASIRSLLRRPSYSVVAVLVLALGLSACIAVFTYINGFYQPFPGVEGKRLVRVFGVENEDPYQDISYLDFLDYSSADGAFEALAATQPFYAASVRHEAMTEVACLEAVSGEYFSVLDIELSVGRGLSAEDDRADAGPAAVISHAWWLRSFNGDPSVIGSTLYLNFRPFTVVGVASPDFLGTASNFRPDVWIPIAPFRDRYTRWAALAEDREVPLVRVYGRLRPSATAEQGGAELAATALGLDEAYPRESGVRGVRLGAATWIDPRARLAERPIVRLMTVAAAILLLLVCANVANLLLALALGRQHEMAMRSALGASPWRLVRQVLTENVLLSLVAGGVALLLAGPLSGRLGSYFASPSVWGANVARQVSVDLRVMVFALGVSVFAGVLAGLLPAVRASRRHMTELLKAGQTGGAGAPQRIWGRRLPGVHDSLVSAQVALAVVLLVVAGLVLRTLAAASDLDPGFAYDRLVVTHISTSSTTLEPGERERFFREVAEGLSAEPWARAATVADYPLLSPHSEAEFRLDGLEDPVPLVYSRVIPGFFAALDIDVLRGRGFLPGDTTGARDVAMVNEALAQRFFPGANPVGRHLRWPGAASSDDRVFEIVGVVRDTKTRDFMAAVEPTVYFSYPQHAYPTGSALLVSTVGDPDSAVPRLYRWLRDFEPHLAIVNVVSYNDVVRGFLYPQRMNAEMFSVLAALGLALATVGVFSVMSLAVSRRTREIGIRVSIGAMRGDIGRLVILRTLGPVLLGLGVGLAASFGLAGLVRGLLFGVEPNDPLALAAGAAVLLVAALTAAYLPARRATAVDPVEVLRQP